MDRFENIPPTPAALKSAEAAGQQDALHTNARESEASATSHQPSAIETVKPSQGYGEPAEKISPLDTSAHLYSRGSVTSYRSDSPPTAGLRVQTDFHAPIAGSTKNTAISDNLRIENKGYLSPTKFPSRTPSLLALAAQGGFVEPVSPASVVSSPLLNAMTEMTPLPSPIVGESPGPWKRMISRTGTGSSVSSIPQENAPPGPLSSPPKTQQKRKHYSGLKPAVAEARSATVAAGMPDSATHGKNRSISEYVPDITLAPRPRNITMAAPGAGPSAPEIASPTEKPLQREEHLATQRGLGVAQAPPTPPASSQSGAGSSDGEVTSSETRSGTESLSLEEPVDAERFEAVTVRGGHKRKWRALKSLGQGTFSKVILAIRMDQARSTQNLSREDDKASEISIIGSRKLVAVKIIGHGPAGGADEARIETSLQRELEILKSIHHPSLIHLLAYRVTAERAILVLNYCPGGDLFDLAAQKIELLVPPLIRRIFAELVAAVRYLHSQWIVHRDIKLENVLLNIDLALLQPSKDWQTFPAPVVTLTDLGLSRRIPMPPESPLLQTRCGSEDYASPELMMGQPYDGRASDAWALGVLLYTLMEGRLPFDARPGQHSRSRTAHRVARVEWQWYRYADHDGEWDSTKGSDLSGARLAVEGLLRRARTRLSLDTIAEMEWVRAGVQVKDGLQVRDDDVDDHNETSTR
ncbi:kinase-like protein [Xylona heveae TC161]|uniref:Kinase-like protein n=1 Tax=Xylona heveae (strain CBS 132557 / TC161) TaxID=1328760 RepID=A0A165G3S2_XYLHT|nr:kinase-like protein [Xylona heveae TC161]KZF21706.1 kinase-like protein [Xylona heveae TC161]